jgi:hypothetical protein
MHNSLTILKHTELCFKWMMACEFYFNKIVIKNCSTARCDGKNL